MRPDVSGLSEVSAAPLPRRKLVVATRGKCTQGCFGDFVRVAMPTLTESAGTPATCNSGRPFGSYGNLISAAGCAVSRVSTRIHGTIELPKGRFRDASFARAGMTKWLFGAAKDRFRILMRKQRVYRPASVQYRSRACQPGPEGAVRDMGRYRMAVLKKLFLINGVGVGKFVCFRQGGAVGQLAVNERIQQF